MLSLPKKSLVTELDLLFEKLDSYNPQYKQAFSLARQKISYHAFKELFLKTTELSIAIPSPDLCHGHQVFAIDGTTLSVPATEETISEFGVKKRYSKSCIIPKVSMLYDVTNDLISDVILGNVRSGERAHAELLLDSPALESASCYRPILLFDRGYPSRKIIQALHQKDLLYLMRCSKSFLSCVNDEPLGESVVMDIHKRLEIPLKIIKFPLESGEIEMLVTNIFDPKLKISDFKELYFRRLGNETKYGELKNRLLIEKFCGKKPECIRQEFYAHLFMTNIVPILKKECDKKIRKETAERKRKRDYQMNRSFLCGLTVRAIFFLLQESLKGILDKVIEKAQKERSPLRPNKKCEYSGAQYRKTFDMNQKHISNKKEHSDPVSNDRYL